MLRLNRNNRPPFGVSQNNPTGMYKETQRPIKSKEFGLNCNLTKPWSKLTTCSPRTNTLLVVSSRNLLRVSRGNFPGTLVQQVEAQGLGVSISSLDGCVMCFGPFHQFTMNISFVSTFSFKYAYDIGATSHCYG